MNIPKNRIEVASDVLNRNGIGVELYRNDEIIIEIFRDDTEKIKETMKSFNKEIPWDFVDNTKQE